MSVIINELEVITSSEPAATGTSTVQPPQPAVGGPTPSDLRIVARHLTDRVDRVRAD